MRIDTVKAVSFGPFAGEMLEFANEMTVIFGHNESGKSSWHAAIYTALCGIKRSRGQPTREDRSFASRHRPWRGTTWRVTAVVTLDNGRTIEIDQELGPGGRSVATDRGTNRPISGDIIRSGAVDGATLLGLTRETAIATLFVRQADMLRVLNDAGALQEYLERAAATSSVDTTAEEALARIAAYRKDRVGLLREGSRGPLAAATRRLAEARVQLDEAEEKFESYQELLARRHSIEIEVREVEQQLADVAEHERERERRERWVEIQAAERRLEQARLLSTESADTHAEIVDKQLVTDVTRAVAAFETRPAEPPTVDGPTSEEIGAELVTVPEMPAGDLEPSSEVTAMLERWRKERQRLAAHDEIEPTAAKTSAPAAPAELRRLAEELELPVLHVDSALVDEVERRRSLRVPPAAPAVPRVTPAAPKPSGSLVPLAAGVVLAITGATLLALGSPIIGVILLLLGAGVTGAGVLSRRGAASGHAVPLNGQEPAIHPSTIPADLEFPRLEARLALQQEAEAQAQRRRDSAIQRMTELDLSRDPGELRRLAAEGDAATTAEARRLEWRRRRNVLGTAEAEAAEALNSELMARGITLEDATDLDAAFASYAEQCRERAAVARQAERRDGLEAQLATRRAAEAAWAQDRAAREAAEGQLLTIAQDTGCLAESIDELADALRGWIADQEQAAEARQLYEQTAARLDQLLDGVTLEELEAEFAGMEAALGEPPPYDASPLKDRIAELRATQTRAHERRELLAELAGQIDGAEKHLLDVSAAIEGEARATTEVSRLTALAEDLDLASEFLGAAQEKVHADIAPVLNDTIRPWVPRITGGRYDDIRVNPATLEIEAHEAGGQFRPATVLSHGTTEQLFLLLRLALAQRLATTDEKAPIILDDITVQSDANRTIAALDLLHDLSSEHQVVVFSQEEEVLHWAEQHLHEPNGRLIHLPARV